MATLIQLGQAIVDTTLQAKIKVAIVRRALLVLGEAIGAMTLAQTQKRQALADSVLRTSNINILVWTAAVITTLDSTAPTDVEIETTITNIWSDMSGVTSQDV